jgi:RNA-binding protein 25
MSDIKPSEVMSPNTESQSQSSPTPQSPSFAPLSFKPIGKPIIQLKTSSSHQAHHHHHPVAAAMNQAFAADQDDEDQTSSNKRAKLAQLTQSSHSADERKKQVKRLVESIPTDRDELFNYNIDWTQLDAGLMDKRIKPWINKKIVEYIGEEEQSLNEFICTKIEQRQRPERLLEEVKVILDEEAELFVKKLWRLIVYETESKRCGLSK